MPTKSEEGNENSQQYISKKGIREDESKSER